MNKKILKYFKPVNENDSFTTKEIFILEKNHLFFSNNQKYVHDLIDIIDGRSKISIRILDWFITNYSKKNGTFYKLKINGNEEYFYVNNEYKNQLYGYSKKYFDAYCRRKKIMYIYRYINDKNVKEKIVFILTIAQLNFFQWVLKNKIITYVDKHFNEIKADMKETLKKNKENKIHFHSSTVSSNMSDDVELDPMISLSPDVKCINISSQNSNVLSKYKRQKLSKSVFETGIKKSYKSETIKLLN